MEKYFYQLSVGSLSSISEEYIFLDYYFTSKKKALKFQERILSGATNIVDNKSMLDLSEYFLSFKDYIIEGRDSRVVITKKLFVSI